MVQIIFQAIHSVKISRKVKTRFVCLEVFVFIWLYSSQFSVCFIALVRILLSFILKFLLAMH